MSDPSVTRQILLTLVDLSVKTAVFAAAAELLLRLVDGRDTRLRHAAWVAVLCGMLALPLSLFFPGFALRLPAVPLAAEIPAPAPARLAASPAPPAEPASAPAYSPAPVRTSAAAVRQPAPAAPAAPAAARAS
ncbi:MAG TPA: 2-oxoglutarate dehydrogenase, E2 component, dihydrolipoamide succinyltransferase, partial [Thermoanaerobaculia bacterium]|nr:2-oxoglutarate dehydrogenase, E2 component, dihydrolipoamide succinyltransferase [Thermoanaerobaculia bacterium]